MSTVLWNLHDEEASPWASRPLKWTAVSSVVILIWWLQSPQVLAKILGAGRGPSKSAALLGAPSRQPSTATRFSAGPSTARECLMMNGLAYGPFRDGEGPGSPLPFPTREQIDEDLGFVSKITKKIRIYASDEKYAVILPLAKKHGLSVMLGVDLVREEKANEDKIDAAVNLAKARNEKGISLFDISSIIVGNETLSNSGNESLTNSQQVREEKERLIRWIRRVKAKLDAAKLPIPVSTAQVASAWESNLDLANEVDFVVAHFYPFWDRQPVDQGAATVLTNYKKLKADLRAKYGRDIRVVIGETGWPSGGGSRGGAVPNPENQRRFVEEFTNLACGNGLEFYYFEAFDEEWKWQEGGSEEWQKLQNRPRLPPWELPEDWTFSGKWLGSSWGIFRSNGSIKSTLIDLFDQPPPGSRASRDIFIEGPLSAYYDMGVDSWPGGKHDWVTTGGDKDNKGTLIMSYPAGQDSGAVFITVGKPTQPPRPWKDFSEFETLSIQMRADRDGDRVEIGVKHRTDPNTGHETRIVEKLTKNYQLYRIHLSDLKSGHLRVPEDLKQLNLVVEFVFEGPRAETVFVRNIRYEPK